MARTHGYNNDDNPIETACGRLAYDVSTEGDLVEPPRLLITTDPFMVTCRRCIDKWGCHDESVWRQIINGPDVIDREEREPIHIPCLFWVKD